MRGRASNFPPRRRPPRYHPTYSLLGFSAALAPLNSHLCLQGPGTGFACGITQRSAQGEDLLLGSRCAMRAAQQAGREGYPQGLLLRYFVRAVGPNVESIGTL